MLRNTIIYRYRWLGIYLSIASIFSAIKEIENVKALVVEATQNQEGIVNVIKSVRLLLILPIALNH